MFSAYFFGCLGPTVSFPVYLIFLSLFIPEPQHQPQDSISNQDMFAEIPAIGMKRVRYPRIFLGPLLYDKSGVAVG